MADTRIRQWIPTWLGRHWPVVIVAAVASFLLLSNLGADHLWEDEGDTAVLAANVLKHSVPIAWDVSRSSHLTTGIGSPSLS